jgi:hypothetical protein
MHVSVYVFADHDSLGNGDSADEKGGRKAGTNYWGLEVCTDYVACVVSFSVLSLSVNCTNQPFRTSHKSFYNWESDFM